jgi:hypothetical protein
MLRCVEWQKVTEVVANFSAAIFRVRVVLRYVTLLMKALLFLQMSANICYSTQCNIGEELTLMLTSSLIHRVPRGVVRWHLLSYVTNLTRMFDAERSVKFWSSKIIIFSSVMPHFCKISTLLKKLLLPSSSVQSLKPLHSSTRCDLLIKVSRHSYHANSVQINTILGKPWNLKGCPQRI